MGHGGAREGAGRPKGVGQNHSQARVAINMAMDGGAVPFEMLLKTARAIWAEATEKGDTYPDIDIPKAKEAAVYAEKAAPYVHPKLNALTLNDTSGEPFVIKLDNEDAKA